MAEYIEREAVLERVKYGAYTYTKGQHEDCVDAWVDGVEDTIEQVCEALSEIPAADVAPVVHGRWIETKKGFHCSECKRTAGKHPTKRGVFLSDYCPNCGARMDGE